MKRISAIVVLVMITTVAQAQNGEGRQRLQRARIRQGVQSGQLTAPEAARLRAGERRIDRMQRRAGRDGVVTPAEQARIQRAENRQSGRIYRQKHDGQARPGAGEAAPAPEAPSQNQ